MDKWSTLPTKETIEKTKEALTKNNFDVYFVDSEEEAKEKFFEILPKGAEVLTNSSITLEKLGITKEINETDKYDSVKKKLIAMDRETQGRDMQRLGSSPQWAVGSVHAVTEDGHVLIASNTGSQIPGYSYGSDYVIWVVGAQKLVKNVQDGIKRIYEHSLVLESERLKQAYGMPISFVRRILIMNEEPRPGRTSIIIVNKIIGF